MDQRELVRKGETAQSDRFVLVLVMHLSDVDKLLEESRQFGVIATDWYRARGGSAERLQLIAVADPKYHKAIKNFFEGIHATEVQLRPIFKAIPFRLALHDAQGTLLEQCDLLPGKEVTDGPFARLLKGIKQ